MAAKKSKTKAKKKVKPEVKSKKQKRLEREKKREARKGDGSFPDILVVTRERDKTEGTDKMKHWFLGHGEDLSTLYKNGQTVAVYKLRRVSTMNISRKVVR